MCLVEQDTMSPAILVTGASRGIGEAVYRRLTRDGYPVIGTYHTSSVPAARLAEELEQEPFVQVDLADQTSVGALMDGLQGRPLKALVNNAGTIEFETFGKFDLGIWQHSFAVHCDAALKLALGLQEEIQDGGSIINITSTDAFLGGFDTLSYAASKSALDSLTKSLAINLGPRNIRVNAIAPGWIDTDMGTRFADYVTGMTPLHRLGRPDDIAGIASFLISDDAAFVTGQTIVADGGYYLVDPVMKWEAADSEI